MTHEKASTLLVWIAVGVAALIGVLPPALYYAHESDALRAEIEASAQVQSLAITRVINRHPDTWRFQSNLKDELAAYGRTKIDADAARRKSRVLGADGALIVENGELPPSPRIMASAHLFDAGKAVGSIEHMDTLQPMLWETLVVAVGSALLALLVYVALKGIPLRAINNAISDARRAAAEAKSALDEQLAAEARLNDVRKSLEQRAKIDVLLGHLAEVANEGRALPDALGECLRLVCEFTGWAIGHAALVKRDGDFAVTYLNVWHAGAPDRYAAFMNDNEQYRFPLKKGAFATRVLRTRRPVWDRDLVARGSFGRLGFLKQAGLASGIALPVPMSGGLPGLVEFFTAQPVDADPTLLAALERACTHIGRVIERQKSDEEIHRLNAELESRITERTRELEHSNQVLEQRNLESAQVTEMSNLLQTAADMQEAAQILSRMMERLLAPHAGAIYLTASSLNRLDCLTAWGEAKADSVIGLDDCWGVRRARSYGAADPRQDVFCPHAHADAVAQPYLCVPMMAQSTSLGMLHVRFSVAAGTVVAAGESLRVQRLADQVAMALANLKLRQSLREQSIRDTLTGLYNRRYMEETLEREHARAERETTPLAVFMIDVDHFKRYNDQHGHAGGDAVLRALGRILRETLRASDVAARYGGEEFTALLHNTPLAGAREWGERVCEAVRKMEVKSEGQVLPPVTISLGLAMYPSHGKSSTTLLQAADAALYEAKRSGRDRLVVVGGSATDSAAGTQRMVMALPRAMEAVSG